MIVLSLETRKTVELIRTRRCRLMGIVACLAVLLASEAWADGVADCTKAASSLGPSVSYVATGGIWERDGRIGRYRIIVVTEGVEHSGTFVFAQWLSIDESTHEMRAVSTVALDSINNRFGSVVQNVGFDYSRSKSGEGVFDLVFSERLPEGGARATLKLAYPGDVDVEFQR